jgi:hypothetical protein
LSGDRLLSVPITRSKGAVMPLRSASPRVISLLLFALAAGAFAQPHAPAATVPPTKAIAPAALPDPFYWPLELFHGTKLEFKVDLDLIAPLGNGSGNAAVYFKDFAKIGGPRFAAWNAAAGRRVSNGPAGEMVLPPNDPLLREAEPWVDQATLRFYPNVWPVRGLSTYDSGPPGDRRMANLLHIMTLGKSWAARGRAQTDPAKKKEDFRRVIRLGRLLRQDDVLLIQDLVGTALIHIGTVALYEEAKHENDTTMTTLTALAHQDSVVIRLETKERLEEFGIREENVNAEGVWAKMFGPSLELTSQHIDKIIEVATHGKERRFRIEALTLLWYISKEGTSAQKKRAGRILAGSGKDADPIVASDARYLESARWDKRLLQKFWQPPI